MRHLFDAIDSGAYDIPLLIIILALLVGSTVWLRVITARNKKEFFDARDRAQKAFEERGSQDQLTQMSIMDALDRWQVWQRRSFAHVDVDHPTEDDWQALSLYNALPQSDPSQLVM